MENKNIAIIQARMGSTRFPGKSIAIIAGKPLIWHIIYRLRQSRKLSKIYLATSVASENDVLEKYVASLGVEVIRGSEENVFSRFESIFKVTNPETITRVCGDCPLIDATRVDRVLDIIKDEGVDYVKSDIPKSIYQGVDIIS
ncbi:MAG: NTP transferase domain-containing protein, partial [Pseudomonadota bacterium]|nr:NTP transferase domain-containing protein [Pseudomonadota bacterium]